MYASCRRQLPNVMTFLGLGFAFSALVLAIDGDLAPAGLCIMASYVLDGADGATARRLGVTSDFGLQLDSLVDAVAFGVAPSVLVYQHVRDLAFNPLVAWPICAAYLIGGVFRLARFNLLPVKTTYTDSIGLAISTSGATLALGVLANLAYDAQLIHPVAFLVLMVGLTGLMVSRIQYPGPASVLRRRQLSLTVLSVAAVLAVLLSPQLVGLGLAGAYVCFGLLRALYQRV